MKGFKDFGIGFSAMLPVANIVDYSRLAEQKGVGSIFIAESHHYRSGTSTAVAVASATERIKVGLGIINPWTRTPGLIAMETATLDEISDGRFILGLGAAKSAMRAQHITTSPIVAMRECIEIVRRLLKGEKVVYNGKLFQFDGNLGFKPPRREVPIWVAAENQRMLQLAGEMADAVFLTSVSTPSYVRFGIENVRKGARRAGRDPSKIDICSLLLLSTSYDTDAAMDAVKEYVAYYAARVQPIMLRFAGVEEDEVVDIKKAYLKGGLKEASRYVTADLIDKLAISGTPEECRKKLKRYIPAGLQFPILYNILGPDKKEAIALIAEEIFPGLIK